MRAGSFISGALAGCLALAVLAACQSLPDLPDRQFGPDHDGPQYRFRDLSKGPGNTDGTLVLLAFSGGGARAAAMAYGVLEALHRTEIEPGARRRSLLSEVDLISSTSGGSFTSAFYGLHRDRMFSRGADGLTLYERRYLRRPVSRQLAGRVLRNLVRINTSAFNRSDIAAEYYGDTIFGNGTYSDLRRAGRPFIVINANDTNKGSRFLFIQQQFDNLCSTLAGYPVARAVTASSAVDGIFAPIKVRNFAPLGRDCPPVPKWVGAALDGRPTTLDVVETPRDRRRRARIVRWYRTGERYGLPTKKNVPYYAHLADGGSSDNTALWPILRAIGSPVSDWGVRELIASGRVKRVLLVVVNAMPSADSAYDRNPAGPTISEALEKAFDRAQTMGARAAIRMADVLFARLRKRGLERNGSDRRGRDRGRGRGRGRDRGRGHRVAFHGPVVIDFATIRDGQRRRCFNNIKTALDLPASQVAALRRLAVRQLEADPQYRSFLTSVDGKRTGRMRFVGADDFCPPRTTVAGGTR